MGQNPDPGFSGKMPSPLQKWGNFNLIQFREFLTDFYNKNSFEKIKIFSIDFLQSISVLK